MTCSCSRMPSKYRTSGREETTELDLGPH